MEAADTIARSAETPAVMNEIRNKCLGKVKINLEVLEKKFLTYNSDDARKYWKLLACLDKELNRFHNSNQMFNENELGTGAFETSENIVYRNYKIRSECKYQTGFDYQNFSIEGYGTYIKCVGAKLNLLGPDGKLDMRFFVKLIAHDKQLIDKVCNLSRLKEGTKRRSLALIQCVVGKINEMRIMERHEYKHRH
ncbi:hypothetical protein HHI36_021497 [Cryptolaemus montrouzieri]|uniref:Uncharacterized protein n=1 Tax=Cryptolaemus montrouzieri TaxID=559131 RepID=A0ABD2MYB4_9CUCU